MTRGEVLSRQQVNRVRATAAILLASPSDSPSLDALPDADELLQQAAVALGNKGPVLAAAIDALPQEPSWENLSAFAHDDPESFELVALLTVGAYFMSPVVLDSLGRPSGARRRASHEQVVDELSTGILDAVLERGCPVRSLDHVNGSARGLNGRMEWTKP
jgi:hypothetical protein